jgi:hypothetical protein
MKNLNKKAHDPDPELSKISSDLLAVVVGGSGLAGSIAKKVAAAAIRNFESGKPGMAQEPKSRVKAQLKDALTKSLHVDPTPLPSKSLSTAANQAILDAYDK